MQSGFLKTLDKERKKECIRDRSKVIRLQLTQNKYYDIKIAISLKKKSKLALCVRVTSSLAKHTNQKLYIIQSYKAATNKCVGFLSSALGIICINGKSLYHSEVNHHIV